MKTDALWKRYAAAWSLAAEKREAELEACLADDVNYCDPNHQAQGRDALSGYMDQFQSSVPDGHFQIRSILHHHDRSLAHWALLGAQGQVLQIGTSFGLLAEDGRLRNITGFFYPAEERPQV